MRILSWNIRALAGATAERLHKIASAVSSLHADILLLQEVSNDSNFAPKIKRCLNGAKYEDIFFSAADCINDKSYGNVIAIKKPLKILESGCLNHAPWPQFLARASIDVDGLRTQIISVHMPNGSQNGWKKVKTFKALGDFLRDNQGRPCVFGGDFNEPREFRPDGDIISFGHRIRKNGQFTLKGDRRDRSGEVGLRESWHEAIRAVLVPGSAHQLVNVFAGLHCCIMETSHIVRNVKRCFDHLFASEHFVVRDVQYEHKYRKAGISDHSAIWADLEPLSKGNHA